jgi:hypothetical protein
MLRIPERIASPNKNTLSVRLSIGRILTVNFTLGHLVVLAYA